MILTSWVEHNRQDSERFKKWLGTVKDSESDAIYAGLLQAATEMETTVQRLAQLSRELQLSG